MKMTIDFPDDPNPAMGVWPRTVEALGALFMIVEPRDGKLVMTMYVGRDRFGDNAVSETQMETLMQRLEGIFRSGRDEFNALNLQWHPEEKP